MKNKTAKHVTILFDIIWLYQYPRPEHVVYDNGSEFIRWEFWEMLDSYGMTLVPTTVKNPETNSVLEWLHFMLGNQLDALFLEVPIFSKTLTKSCKHVHLQYEQQHQVTVHTHQCNGICFWYALPTDSVYWLGEAKKFEKATSNQQQQEENQKFIHHEYKIGDLILIITPTF